jgi:hypothetical protein
MTLTEGFLFMWGGILAFSGLILFLDWWGRRKEARRTAHRRP